MLGFEGMRARIEASLEVDGCSDPLLNVTIQGFHALRFRIERWFQVGDIEPHPAPLKQPSSKGVNAETGRQGGEVVDSPVHLQFIDWT